MDSTDLRAGLAWEPTSGDGKRGGGPLAAASDLTRPPCSALNTFFFAFRGGSSLNSSNSRPIDHHGKRQLGSNDGVSRGTQGSIFSRNLVCSGEEWRGRRAFFLGARLSRDLGRAEAELGNTNPSLPHISLDTAPLAPTLQVQRSEQPSPQHGMAPGLAASRFKAAAGRIVPPRKDTRQGWNIPYNWAVYYYFHPSGHVELLRTNKHPPALHVLLPFAKIFEALSLARDWASGELQSQPQRGPGFSPQPSDKTPNRMAPRLGPFAC